MEGEMEADVLAEIRRIAASQLELNRSVNPEDELIADLELDSLGLIILAVGLEDRFRLKLSQEESMKVKTVGDLAELVARRAREVQR